MEKSRVFHLHDSGHRQPGLDADVSDSSQPMQPDDPLGDEAAFPMTWQHLAGSAALED